MAMYVALQTVDGPTYLVNPELVSSLTAAPTTPPGTFVDIKGDAPSRIVAVGIPSVVAAALEAGSAGGPTHGVYTPTILGSGALSIIGATEWRFSRVGNVVTVTGRMNVTWTLAGGGQVTFSLPPGLPSDLDTVATGVMTYGPNPLNASPWSEPGGDLSLSGFINTEGQIALVSLNGDPALIGLCFQYVTSA